MRLDFWYFYCCLYGLDNFYYRRFHMDGNNYFKGLYGLDNFYYRRCFGEVQPIMVYTDLIISTIVDSWIDGNNNYCLYGLDNFYYRRCERLHGDAVDVYTDLIISTIVD